MANIIEQIYAYEDSVFDHIAQYLNNITKLPVYLKDKPFIVPDTVNSYLTIRMITSSNSGGMGQDYRLVDGCMQYIVDNTYQIEIMAFRGRPMPVLNYVLGSLVSFKEQMYEDLYSNGISFLTASNVTEANTVLDKDKTRLGARLVASFNTRMVIEDTQTNSFDGVSYQVNSYPTSYEGSSSLAKEGEFLYATT